ncbi:MAG: hypothetical protein LBI69_01990 [Puniceicoccales bacterium]|nr:hypothetical protein [Puniceicoccales bacterium]
MSKLEVCPSNGGSSAARLFVGYVIDGVTGHKLQAGIVSISAILATSLLGVFFGFGVALCAFGGFFFAQFKCILHFLCDGIA